MAVDLTDENRAIVTHLCRELGEISAVYRFGSTADGTSTASSDVDIAVLARNPIPPARRFDIQESLAARIGRDVDLIDLSEASTVLAMQVITTGSVIHETDGESRGRFEDLTFSAYARLNEERRGILERIAAEKSVYGG